MISACKALKVKEKVISLLSYVREEAVCVGQTTLTNPLDNCVAIKDFSEPVPKKMKLEDAEDQTCLIANTPDVRDENQVKKDLNKTEKYNLSAQPNDRIEIAREPMPLFYYDIQKKSYSGYPK